MTPENIAFLLTSITAMLVAIGACLRKSKCTHIQFLGMEIDRQVGGNSGPPTSITPPQENNNAQQV